MRFLIFKILILSICFSANAKPFKSVQGFTFSLDGYELVSLFSSDSAAEFFKKYPSFKSDKFIQFYENYRKNAESVEFELLLKSSDDLGIHHIGITALDQVDIILRNKEKSEIKIKDVCEITTRQTNEMYGINQTIYACMWIPFPKGAKFSFLREVSGIRFGRTIQIEFIKNNRHYVITGITSEERLKEMRKDITLLVESIKF